MADLAEPLRETMGDVIPAVFPNDQRAERLVNELVTESMDIEHVITFLSDSPSRGSRLLSNRLQMAFERVLRDRLTEVERSTGPKHSLLYAVLIDMHEIAEVREDLNGFLTLNYDRFLEHAIQHHLRMNIDYGIDLRPRPKRKAIKVIKLHGSFDWPEEWPMTLGDVGEFGHWIPPGVRKAKERWPFNAIWGLGRAVLDCDVLRIVGCNLSPNDWDLVSLLFTTQQTHANAPPYDVEVIASPRTAEEIKRRFPYLRAKSLLQLGGGLGDAIVAENLGGEHRRYDDLADDERKRAIENTSAKSGNALLYWLKQRAEAMNRDLASLSTRAGLVQAFLEGKEL